MKILKGKDAIELLNEEQFLQHWDQLASECPWSTVFQRKEFVLTWYETYPAFAPIVVTDWDGKHMTGLLTLTSLNKKELSYPGGNLAEYQGWISEMKAGEKFIIDALARIDQEYKGYSLHLKYLPAGIPLDGLSQPGKIKDRTFLKPYTRPIMQCEATELEKELKKKNKKEKINRLKRQGELVFERIHAVDEFRKILPDLILQNEFRKGAMYGKLAFMEDEKRAEFILRAFEKGLLHTTILKVDEEIIASNVGFISGKTVHLQGINTHSPFQAKHSPGILHFLMLGIELHKEGFEYFDLTPGGADGYKSKLASTQDTVFEFHFGSALGKKSIALKEFVKSSLKQLVPKDVLKSPSSPSLKKKTKSLGKSIYLNLLGEEVSYMEIPTREYTIKADSSKNYRKNSLSDLLQFPFEEIKSEFLSDAMRRIENGQEAFTVMENGVLSTAIWWIPKNAKDTAGQLQASPKMECSYANKMDIIPIACRIVTEEGIETPLYLAPQGMQLTVPDQEVGKGMQEFELVK